MDFVEDNVYILSVTISLKKKETLKQDQSRVISVSDLCGQMHITIVETLFFIHTSPIVQSLSIIIILLLNWNLTNVAYKTPELLSFVEKYDNLDMI